MAMSELRLYLDAPPFTVVTSPAALGVSSPLQPLPGLGRHATEAQIERVVIVAVAGHARARSRRRVESLS